VKSTVNISLRVNYGMQRFYRDNGIEPCCGICRHFQVTPEGSGYRFCERTQRYVEDNSVCLAPDRAPGSEG
jgi:hypothetical protein